jgi:hypothetical protein
MLNKVAQDIVDILNDYENNNMTVQHVLTWVNQFDDVDREFILNELLNIFKQTYYSKEKCIEILKEYIGFLSGHYQYTAVTDFLRNTVFLDLQNEEDSQKELLALLNDILIKEYGITLRDCGKKPMHYVYLDDILATGNKTFTDLSNWLKTQNDADNDITNYDYVKKENIKLNICFLCLHTWGYSNVEYRLMMEFDVKIKKHLSFFRYFEIENNIKAHNAKLNHMLPIDNQDNEFKTYLNSLEDAVKFEDRAFRKNTQPSSEELFSSPENRTRLENIFLRKGIEILQQVQNLTVKQIRPLGYTIKSHRTFGLGTLFFTFRNIPNNCPIVFWWGSKWYPLFIVKNRGKK